jgi:hypothetical protein
MMYFEQKRSLLHNLGQLTVQLDTFPDRRDTPSVKYSEVVKDLKQFVHAGLYQETIAKWTTSNMRVTVSVSELKR